MPVVYWEAILWEAIVIELLLVVLLYVSASSEDRLLHAEIETSFFSSCLFCPPTLLCCLLVLLSRAVRLSLRSKRTRPS